MNNYFIKNKNNIIFSFRNENNFLSNFYIFKPIEYNGILFSNSESMFQSMKCKESFKNFELLSPIESKKLGKRVNMVKNWDEIKDDIMYEVCYLKFSKNKYLKDKLIKTGNAELIEGNNYGDIYWGMIVDKNKNLIGKNKLGVILMRIREELK